MGTLKNHIGFSMIEVLVSLVILSGGLLALARFQGNVTANESYNKQRIQAAHISQLTIDKLRVRANELIRATPTITIANLKTSLTTFSTSLATTMNADSATDDSIQKVLTPNTTYTVSITYPTGSLSSAITNVSIPVQVKVEWSEQGNSGCSSGSATSKCEATFKTLISKASQQLF